MGRAPCCDRASVKRGPWSPDEDAILKSYIENHGTGGNWIALPQKAGRYLDGVAVSTGSGFIVSTNEFMC